VNGSGNKIKASLRHDYSVILARVGRTKKRNRHFKCEQVVLHSPELAERSAVHRTYVAGKERGERNVGLINLFRLARALGLTLAELLATAESFRRGEANKLPRGR
jgi:transcriptional regulator with XRE-family HTH domain